MKNHDKTAVAHTSSKFDGMFTATAPPTAVAEPEDTKPSKRAVAEAGKARLAKSNDPEWKSYSLFLKKATHTDAMYNLRKQGSSLDLSELAERLFQEWLVKGSPL